MRSTPSHAVSRAGIFTLSLGVIVASLRLGGDAMRGDENVDAVSDERGSSARSDARAVPSRTDDRGAPPVHAASIDTTARPELRVRVTPSADAVDVNGRGETPPSSATLGDASPEAVERELEALFDDRTPDAILTFCRTVTHADPWVQDAAQTGLYRHRDRTRVLAELGAMLGSDDRDERVAAADLLDEMGEFDLPWHEIDKGPIIVHALPRVGGSGRQEKEEAK